jgi:hypothetical protein
MVPLSLKLFLKKKKKNLSFDPLKYIYIYIYIFNLTPQTLKVGSAQLTSHGHHELCYCLIFFINVIAFEFIRKL